MSNPTLIKAIEDAAKLLIGKNLSLAFAESATAGKASAEFSIACNAGKFLKGGFVCYDASLKTRLLIDADIHIGITGLPCPGGSETPEKPVGTMFIYVLLHGTLWFNERLQLSGSHQQILDQTVIHLARLLSVHTEALEA